MKKLLGLALIAVSAFYVHRLSTGPAGVPRDLMTRSWTTEELGRTGISVRLPGTSKPLEPKDAPTAGEKSSFAEAHGFELGEFEFYAAYVRFRPGHAFRVSDGADDLLQGLRPAFRVETIKIDSREVLQISGRQGRSLSTTAKRTLGSAVHIDAAIVAQREDVWILAARYPANSELGASAWLQILESASIGSTKPPSEATELESSDLNN
jgi:hypothetical protein